MKISLSSGRTITGSPDKSILESLKNEGIFLTSSCGSKGTCGKCKIVIRSGKVNARSAIKLTQEELQKNYALACQSFPLGDLSIEIPKESHLTLEGRIATGRSKDLQALLPSTGVKIEPLTERIVLHLPAPSLDDNISDLERLKRELVSKGLGCLRVPFRFLTGLAEKVRKSNWEITLSVIYSENCNEITNIFPGDKKSRQYGIAIDIGTTTLVVYLVNLNNGDVIDIASTYNSQINYGDDVITRIVYASEHNGLRHLNHTVISDINAMLALLRKNHHINIKSIDNVVAAGNTTMTHLFLGLDPGAIREEPYIPTANVFPLSFAGELGIKINPDTPVYTFPCVASYVGGDIAAGVLASRLHKKNELCLFLDIGTNGEIVLGNSEFLVAAACSAGPCFEGSGIKHGMRATEGAIEDVVMDRKTLEPEIKIIGGTAPIGICGSGMIDLAAEMFLTGILNQKGKLQKGISQRVREAEDGAEFVLYQENGRDLVLTEPDIENIIRAKAAIYAGCSILLKEVGFTFNDVRKVYIAGGFGKFLDINKAIILGMLPDISREKFEFLGNTSITGAYLCMLSRRMREEAEEIARKMTYLELSVSRSFMDEYVSGLFIPHTNMEAFPSVKKLMGG
ncbi:MAG: DUF4445 domain-containing protein [Nitrospirae bacterium]|nr:DUF4445 domain-containing protein [Nitrospirota bacterium]